MDFSRLHTYTPPQYVPENTGYTYALSSSYSTEALDFENTHQLHPVYDSPRMSRRRLRPVTTEYYSTESMHNESIGSNHSFMGSVLSYKETSIRSAKQQQNHRSLSKQLAAVSRTPRKSMVESSVSSQSSILSYASDASVMSTVLDESSIREKTELDHFWGLDEEDGDSKGGNATLTQANGDILTGEMQTGVYNGYTCADCSILSERKDILTAYCTSHAPTSTVYSRSRNKDKSRVKLFTSHAHRMAKYTLSTAAAWLLQLYQTILLKTGFCSRAHSSYCGQMNVKELITGDGHLNINGESLCDDCKGMQHETHKSTEVQSIKYMKHTRITRTIWLVFSYAGSLLLQMIQAAGTVAWFVSRKVLSILWLAIVSPGKAATGAFWWLGTGWYQLITLMSLLDVFLLTRCLSRLLRWLFLLIPFLLLFVGLRYYGLAGLWSLLPTFNGTALQTTQRSKEIVPNIQTNEEIPVSPQIPLDTGHHFDWSRVAELEKQVALLNDKCSQTAHTSDVRHGQLVGLLEKLQEQVREMSDKEKISILVRNLISQHSNVLREDIKWERTDHSQDQVLALHQKHELRIAELELMLQKLSNRSEEVYKEVELAKHSTTSNENEEQYQHLESELKRLEIELSTIKSELSSMQELKASCAKIDGIQGNVDNQVRELVNLLIFGSRHTSSESFREWLSSEFASQTELQILLKDLEMKILKNLTQHWIETKRPPDAEMAACAINDAGISGISEEQVHVIVGNALRLYSEDRTGMVDFALESGGGSILSTRCSETYETATAVMSLFGVPLWYFSQSPRVVIQPDVYPGNCWAFKGSQGYLVIRLSVEIYPSAFTLEHVPKSLSPAGNISSAPKDFSVYGLEDEYQEEGMMFGKYTYNQDGEAIQTFLVREKSLKKYQIIELRMFSNWGHPEYTCLYRFRVHGNPSNQ